MVKNKLNNQDFVMSSDRDQEATYYIRGNPVSLYCTNIAVIMGGRNNIWRGGRNSSGIVDKDGNPIPARTFDDFVSYNDGNLEFSTFSSMFHLILQKSRRVMQSGGPFIFDFKKNDPKNTTINIDGEFYQLSEVTQISIEKYFRKRPLRILIND